MAVFIRSYLLGPFANCAREERCERICAGVGAGQLSFCFLHMPVQICDSTEECKRPNVCKFEIFSSIRGFTFVVRLDHYCMVFTSHYMAFGSRR